MASARVRVVCTCVHVRVYAYLMCMRGGRRSDCSRPRAGKRSDIGRWDRKHVRGSAMAVCLTPHLPRFIPTPTIHSTRVHRPLEHGYTITIARNNPRHHCRRQLLRISNQAKAASLRAWQHLQHKDIMILFAVCFSLDNPPGPGI